MENPPLKVLLVEDNPGDARMVGAMLSGQDDGGFELRHAKRLDEALEALEAEPFDAVLLDLSLPDSRGIDTIDHTKDSESERGTPIIVITGYYTEEDSLQTMQHGAQDYLLKNDLRPEALARSIRFAVERRRAKALAETTENEQRQAREIESLEQMSAPLSAVAMARSNGVERLSEASPESLEKLVEQYCELIDQAIEARVFKRDGRTSRGLRAMAQRLGFLGAGPRDVVDLHVRSIRRTRPVKMTTSYVVAEEARLMLIELLGNLASYYRDHMTAVDRPTLATSPEARRDRENE